MEHLHSIASTTQHNFAVESRQMREISENKKTRGPEEFNADYFLLQPADKISGLLTSTPLHELRPELSRLQVNSDLCATDLFLSGSTMLYRLPSIVNSTSCINSAVKFSVSLSSTPLHEWRPELSRMHVNLDLCRNKDLHSYSNLVIMVRVLDFCPARFHQASANIVSDQPKKPEKNFENPKKSVGRYNSWNSKLGTLNLPFLVSSTELATAENRVWYRSIASFAERIGRRP